MKRFGAELSLLAVAAAFALSASGGSYWLDEAFSLRVAHSSWDAFFQYLRHDNTPPLHYALLKAWTAVAGDGERAVRALSAIFSVASVVPAIALGRRLAGTREGGLVAGLFMACSTQLALHAASARMYSLLLLLAATATWLCVELADASNSTARWRTGAAYAAVTTLGAYTHYSFAFLTAAHVAAFVAIYRRASLPLCFAALAGWLPFAAWVPVFLEQLRNGSRAWIAPPGLAAPWFAFSGVLGAPLTAVLVVALAAAAWRRKVRVSRELFAIGAVAALTILVPFAISLVRPVFLPFRHGVIAVPAIAAALGALATVSFPRRLLLGAVAAALALRASTHLGLMQLAAPRDASSDRAAAALLASKVGPQDAIVFVGLSGLAIDHYLSKQGVTAHRRSFPADLEAHPGWIDPSAYPAASLGDEAEKLEAALSGKAVWIVGDDDEPITGALRKRFEARTRSDDLPLDGLFFDRLERYEARSAP